MKFESRGLALVGVAVAFVGVLSAEQLQNIALGKACTFSRKPNYSLTSDKDDALQLTDGKYMRDNKGCLWTKKDSVGWMGADHVMRVHPPAVTVDLGEDSPIRGFSWNLAFGVAGVTFPDSIDVYVSVDGKSWYHVGDMLARAVTLRIMPPPGYYNVYRAWADDMFCHGRYVKFIPINDPCCFVDEIEVYRGDDSLLSRPMPGEPTQDPVKFHGTLLLRNRLRKDAEAVGASDEVSARISTVFADDFKPDFKTVLPLNDIHRAIFAENAKRLRKSGIEKPAFWVGERWDDLSPVAMPPTGSMSKCELSLEMMRGEVRAASVNIVNPTDAELVCDFSVEGFDETTPIMCQEVVFADTRQYRATASALRSGDGPSVIFAIPAGISKQTWISVRRPLGAAGIRRGRVVARLSDGTVLSLPFAVTVYDIDYPDEPLLLVGGWDYLDGIGHAKNKNTRQKSIAYIRDLGARVAWATKMTMPRAKFDAGGGLAGPLDFSAWDKWIRDVPGMRVYAVFADMVPDFFGEKIGTVRCDRMIEAYCRAWGEHLRETGFDGAKRRVLLMPFDEPNSSAQADYIVRCIRPIHAAGRREIGVFEDPQFPNPERISSEFWNLCDVISPLYSKIEPEKARVDFYSKLVEKGKQVWLYEAHGPSRTHDPILYYRRQAWAAYMIGGKDTGSQFWAFGCGGSKIGNSWTAYAQTQTEFSPYFVTPDGPMDAKQSEGIREGQEDFELLCLYEARFGRNAARKIASLALEKLPYKDCDWDVSGCPRGLLDQLRVKMLRKLVQRK